jgi:winged helix DNA-binding protein
MKDDRGRDLFDLPDAPRPAADTPAPVRFLPVYDNVTLSHADRGRIVEEHHRRTVLELDMISFGSILVDGFGRAIWRVERERGGDGVTLDVALLENISAGDIDAVGAEGERLLTFLEPTRPTQMVRFRHLSTA